MAEQVLDKYKCDICGKSYDRQSKLNLHKYHCTNKQLREKNNQLQECSHEFRLLESNKPQEYQAMKMNYTEVCKKCLTLQ